MPPRSMFHGQQEHQAAQRRAVRAVDGRRSPRLLITIATPFVITPLSGVLISWVAEFLRSQLSNGRTSKFSPMAVKSTCLEKDPKQGLFECPVTRSSFFSRLAAAKLTAMYFRAPAETDTSLDRRLDRSVESGDRAAGFHVHPHQLRHSHATHAVQRGVDVFTLQATLGHSSSATTGHYVASNPRDSSSLRLG